MLDEQNEAEVRRDLLAHFTALKYFEPALAAEQSLSVDGAATRFAALLKVVPSAASEAARVLVSGMGSGSEMLAARRFGFQDVHGTEVDPFYVTLCAKRFQGQSGFTPCHYDGGTLPYGSDSFDVIVSGHIIEHTADPFLYLREHVRVLKPGGHLLLEFPTRYHWRELHTGLPSAEWLPARVRSWLLMRLGGPGSPLSEPTKHKCRTIVVTGLKQVSLGGVRRWLARIGGTELLDVSRPAPGVVRCVIRRS